jgi:hypothetical protein
VLLTCRHQSVEACCNSVARHLSSQAHFHRTLCNRVEVGVCQLTQWVKRIGFVKFI